MTLLITAAVINVPVQLNRLSSLVDGNAKEANNQQGAAVLRLACRVPVAHPTCAVWWTSDVASSPRAPHDAEVLRKLDGIQRQLARMQSSGHPARSNEQHLVWARTQVSAVQSTCKCRSCGWCSCADGCRVSMHVRVLVVDFGSLGQMRRKLQVAQARKVAQVLGVRTGAGDDHDVLIDRLCSVLLK